MYVYEPIRNLFYSIVNFGYGIEDRIQNPAETRLYSSDKISSTRLFFSLSPLPEHPPHETDHATPTTSEIEKSVEPYPPVCFIQ